MRPMLCIVFILWSFVAGYYLCEVLTKDKIVRYIQSQQDYEAKTNDADSSNAYLNKAVAAGQLYLILY